MKKNCIILLLLSFVLNGVNAQGDLKSLDQIPIIAWSANETTPKRLKEIKDAGFTAYIAGGSSDEIQKLLDLSKLTGLLVNL